MEIDEVFTLANAMNKNQFRIDYLLRHHPDLVEALSTYSFGTPYPLDWGSRIGLVKAGLREVGLCETCREPVNKHNYTLHDVHRRFCSLDCAYRGDRCDEETLKAMGKKSKEAWTPERKKAFAGVISLKHKEGSYISLEGTFKARRNTPAFREKQVAAARAAIKANPPMQNPVSRAKMIASKRKQFEGYELPSWFFKGDRNRPCYNPRPLAFFERLILDLKLEGPFYVGKNEKRFGRYWVDFYAEGSNLCIEWDEAHHEVQVEQDRFREESIKSSNESLQLIRAVEKEIILNGSWDDEAYFRFRKEILEKWKRQ